MNCGTRGRSADGSIGLRSRLFASKGVRAPFGNDVGMARCEDGRRSGDAVVEGMSAAWRFDRDGTLCSNC